LPGIDAGWISDFPATIILISIRFQANRASYAKRDGNPAFADAISLMMPGEKQGVLTLRYCPLDMDPNKKATRTGMGEAY
jgi:hypothetical protein